MNILALILLIIGAIALLITAPFALFVPYKAFDDTERPFLVYLSVAACVAVPLAMGWCLYRAWDAYQSSDFGVSVQFGIFPAAALVLFGAVVAVATKLSKSKPLNND